MRGGGTVARLRVVQIPSFALLDRRGPSQTAGGYRHGRERSIDPDGTSLKRRWLIGAGRLARSGLPSQFSDPLCQRRVSGKRASISPTDYTRFTSVITALDTVYGY